ncbi:MAG: FliH/SctL family protein [Candidatus Gastranaerophilaceae bacterium]
MIIKKRSELGNKAPVQKKSSADIQAENEKIDLFDLDNIDFSQRQERRRGDRRRGYRRIDDRNLISRAQQEAGTIKDSAAKEGYNAGLEQAKEDIQRVKDAVLDFLKAKQEVFEYIAPDILEISVDIAKKIVKKEIEQDPQIVLETILEVLNNISKDETKVNIKVNPAQLSLTKENIPQMISSIGLEAKINVLADATIELGSCIVQTSNGLVDATIDTQLEIIKEAFKGM